MKTKELIKSTGATFTPKGLADYLTSRILSYVDREDVSVLDPACGDGELLLSMGEHLAARNIDFILNGYDLNNEYLSIAKERSYQFGELKIKLVNGDFLEVVDINHNQLALNFFGAKANGINESVDIVIANPPYVRTQILGTEQAQLLAQKFDLKGRVDLYYPFLIAMTASLKKGGIIGVITSNRYLSTKSGESVRKFLNENFEILEIVDLGDTKLFDAAVLPAIFIGRKRGNAKTISDAAKFIKIYEELNGYNGDLKPAANIYEVLDTSDSGYFNVNGKRFKKTDGVLICRTTKGYSWELLSDSESLWVNKIDNNASCLVGDLFKVRVGIKTTADKVFINDEWDKLGTEKPEVSLLKDLISQENIGRWGTTAKATLQILYPHYNKDGNKTTIDIEQFPKAKKYFEKFEARLKERKYLIDAGRKWFELWVPHNPDFWNLPKLVFPDISLSPRFYFDEGGKLVNGNCYWIVAEMKESVEKLLLIQGVSNSKLMTKYHDLVFNNKLYSGRRRYFTQYVERYPLPDCNSPISQAIIEIVKKLNTENNARKITLLEEQLEIKVAEAFGVSPIFKLD
ncbi:N-6 DNA methylase [Cytophagaceae bacterium 50A-KIRBA]|uniref:Eco57I restriction-modification methylase domain-containing protein n=1 Tax=Aquirufa ecclesiirivi TaxID=2715124 RepID=UPI00140A1C9B|nr:N-6 DNA methylase [Aquirufa ecclesiirivi]NHC48054.1 N-6 DNA methylase [Aquirufa ecclesiirivi]